MKSDLFDLQPEHIEVISRNLSCKTCNNEKLIHKAAGPTISAEECPACSKGNWDERQELEVLKNRISRAFIPSRFLDASISEGSPTILKNWLINPTKSLFFYGPSSTGKTEQSVALLFEFLKRGKNVLYLDCSEYLMDRRTSYAAKGLGNIGDVYTEKTEIIRDSLKRADVVVIDNIGTGTSSEWTKTTYDQLFTSRHNSGQITIYVSNFTEDPETTADGVLLSSRIGSRAANRVSASIHIPCQNSSIINKEAASISIEFAELRSARVLNPDESTFLNIWAREGLFRLMSNRERTAYTRKSEIDPDEVIEVSCIREYVSWSGYHVIIDGPILDYDDANVLAGILHIYHRTGRMDGQVSTTLSELARTLHNKSVSGSVQRSLKRALTRLAKCRPSIISQKDQKKLWIGGFIDSVLFEGKNKGARVNISLNRSMIPLYRDHKYTYLKLPVLVGVSQYAQGMYRFLTSQKDEYKFIGIEKWKTILGVNKDVDETWFKRCMRSALKELISNELILVTSHIDKKGIVHTYKKCAH